MRRLRLAIAACATTGILALVAHTLLAGGWRPPLRGPGPEAAGVTSRATLEHAATWANHALYGLLVLLCAAAAAAFPWSTSGSPPPVDPPPPSRRSRAAAALAAAVLVASVLVVALASPAGDLLRPLEDRFHEGEYLGFLPAFEQGGGMGRTFLIHGFGMNVLPSLAARALGGGIPAARAVRLLYLLAAWGGCFALLWAASARADGGRRILRFAAMATVFAIAARAFEMTERLALHAWAIAAALWLLARARAPSRAAVVAPGLAVGALAALGPLYNYSEAVSFAPVVALLPLLAALRAPGRGGYALAAICAGAAAVAAGVLAAAGPGPWVAALEHVRYWAATSGAVWFFPLSSRDSVVLFWLAAAAHAAAIALLARAAARSGWRAAAAEHAEVVVLLLFAALAMRAQLGRADLPHLRLVGIPSAALFAVVADRFVGAAPQGTFRLAALLAVLLAAWLGVVGLARPRRVALAAARLSGLPAALRTPDDAVVPPDLRVAIDALRAEARASRCFYTLSSEGAYYYLLRVPSCSRFHQVVYARTAEAQAEVVRDLERGAPELVLMESGTWFDHIDEVPVSVSNAAVDAYVRERYRPDRVLGTHVVWRRAAAPPR